jgi:hypothetical protein
MKPKIFAKPLHRLRHWKKQIHNFIIHEGHKPILYLEISSNLSDRFNQTTEFNKAFPEHSLSPIRFFKEDSLDFLCHNFFNGKPINEALEKNTYQKRISSNH